MDNRSQSKLTDAISQQYGPVRLLSVCLQRSPAWNGVYAQPSTMDSGDFEGDTDTNDATSFRQTKTIYQALLLPGPDRYSTKRKPSRKTTTTPFPKQLVWIRVTQIGKNDAIPETDSQVLSPDWLLCLLFAEYG